MPPKTLDSIDVSGKRVLMRVDFNVPLESGRITDDRRIEASLPGIRSVLERGGSLVLMSHLGRPSGSGYEPSHSLEPVAARLRELLRGTTVHFPSHDCVDADAAAAVQALRPGEVLLLENLRFHPGEKKGDAGFAAKLAAYGDIYCNDAFGTAHRPDASMVAVPKAMSGRPRVAGPLMAKEVRYLSQAIDNLQRPAVAILGGAKVSDKLACIERFIDRFDYILVGGAMAYTFMRALNRRTGKSLVEESMVKQAHEIVEKLAMSRSDGMVPIDHVCGREPVQGTAVDVFSWEVPDGWMGLDIGPKTVGRFSQMMSGARTVVWNGPMGMAEVPPFDEGTRAIARAVAGLTKTGATTIVGGGDTAAAVDRFGMGDQFSHVSTGGGASLELLEGREFESLAVLDQ